MDKWFKYTIDYEYGTAEFYSRDRQEKPISTFYALATECFGIRKSIGETKLLDEELVPITATMTTPKNSPEQVMNIGMGDYYNTMIHALTNREREVEVPEGRIKKAAFILVHSGGDMIIFSATKDKEGNYWKIFNEWGNFCTCKKEGKEELSCEVHHFWVKNHDKKCDCNKK